MGGLVPPAPGSKKEGGVPCVALLLSCQQLHKASKVTSTCQVGIPVLHSVAVTPVPPCHSRPGQGGQWPLGGSREREAGQAKVAGRRRDDT